MRGSPRRCSLRPPRIHVSSADDAENFPSSTLNPSEMKDLDFKSPEWCRAATLAERLSARRARPGGYDFDEALAERRLRRWREQTPFDKDEFWQQRLALDGMCEDEFQQLLGVPPSVACADYTTNAEWLAELARAFSEVGAREDKAQQGEAQRGEAQQ